MNPIKPLKHIADAIVFPIKAIGILAICALVNWMTSPGHWWVQWVAMGLGIAMIVKFSRALRALLVTGAIAGLGVVLWRWWKNRRASV
jgi:hypothetical protein